MQTGIAAYDDLRVVGVGPVATVHVFDGSLGGTPMAIKVFPEPMDRFTRTAFDRERKALGGVSPESSILRVDEVVEGADGRPGLCMELCEQSLAELLEAHGRLTVEDTMAIALAAVTALTVAHGVGVVHGAVTPSNVLLRADGEPVLADFGLALRHGYPRSATHGSEWAAPETVQDGTLTERSDVYGLGAVLYTALIGRPPSADLDLADVPEPVRELLFRLLAPDPADRPEADTLLAELTGALATDAGPADTVAAPEEGFDDFPDETDRMAPTAGDRFFVDWEGGEIDVAVPPDEPPAPLPIDDIPAAATGRGRMLGLAAALAVLIAVPILAGQQPMPPSAKPRADAPQTPEAVVGFTMPSTRKIELELDPPVDQNTTVQLTWRSDSDLDYAVVVAGESLPTKVTLVKRQRTIRVPIDPGRQYCFLVQGTDGSHVYQSVPRSLRGARCTL